MFKKILITSMFMAAIAFAPQAAYAVENCVTVYGGGVVCSAETENIVHKPIETDLGDIRPLLLGSILIGTSFTFFILSRKVVQGTSDLSR